MNIFVEFWVTLWQFFSTIMVAIFHTFVSPARKSVEGEIVLITGSGSGLGRLMSLEFAKRGAIVVGWDVNQDGNEETKRQVDAVGSRMYTYLCDISLLGAVQKVAAQVRRDVGEVTILVNNAGVVTGKPFLELPEDMIVKTLNVNLLSHFWTAKTFLPSMMERNHGHIVNIASIAGKIGTTRLVDYCASKFGDVGFTECLEMEIFNSGKHGVHTTLVCPYFINTGMFEGCVTRFPKLTPPLDQVEVVNKIMNAVLTNQSLLCIPKVMYLLVILKALLPVKAALIIHRFTGASNFMDHFIGRKKNE